MAGARKTNPGTTSLGADCLALNVPALDAMLERGEGRRIGLDAITIQRIEHYYHKGMSSLAIAKGLGIKVGQVSYQIQKLRGTK